jgi:hypothetical protein
MQLSSKMGAVGGAGSVGGVRSGLAGVDAGVASPCLGLARAVLMGMETPGTQSLGASVVEVCAQGATLSFDRVVAGSGNA